MIDQVDLDLAWLSIIIVAHAALLLLTSNYDLTESVT